MRYHPNVIAGYHYQHSGDHGAIGLALLASGQHECLRNHHSKSHTRHSTPAATPAPSQPPTPTSPLATGMPYAPALAQQAYAYLQQQQRFPPSAFGQPAVGLGFAAPYMPGMNVDPMGQQRS